MRGVYRIFSFESYSRACTYDSLIENSACESLHRATLVANNGLLICMNQTECDQPVPPQDLFTKSLLTSLPRSTKKVKHENNSNSENVVSLQ